MCMSSLVFIHYSAAVIVIVHEWHSIANLIISVLVDLEVTFQTVVSVLRAHTHTHDFHAGDRSSRLA